MSTQPASRGAPATLADVITRIEADSSHPPPRRHDLTSAVRKIAQVLGRPPADIEAAIAPIRQRLVPISAAAAGVSAARWRNVRSLFAAAMALAGAPVVRRRRGNTLPPDWRDLLRRLRSDERWKLARLASYCSAQGHSPDGVDDAVVAAFAVELQNGLLQQPKQVHRNTCLTWNRARTSLVGWPQVLLTVPSHRRDYALPLAAYPASFGSELQAYLAHLAGTDLFTETGRAPLSRQTLEKTRRRLLQLAAALVRSGRDPASIGGLADLCNLDNARAALRFIWQRGDQRKTGQLHQLALLLVKLAKHWVKVPTADLEALRNIRKQVDPGHSGMTTRNRARLRQFDDSANVARLVDLPVQIERRIRASNRPTVTDALQMQSALAIAILLVVPIRISNLAAITLDGHLTRARPGGPVHLIFPAAEVKNRVALEFELPPRVLALLNLYVARFRPLLATNPSNHLFTARSGGAKQPGLLGAQIKGMIKRETGFDFNVHAFRHLCAMLFLRAYPGEYETVRLQLGHKSLTTTVRSYCGLEQTAALRRYDQLIERYRNEDRGGRHEA